MKTQKKQPTYFNFKKGFVIFVKVAKLLLNVVENNGQIRAAKLPAIKL